jgi:hypothetical protein
MGTCVVCIDDESDMDFEQLDGEEYFSDEDNEEREGTVSAGELMYEL